jgi:tripartite-type tricarboxylate transporter receptor subunit TctC
MKDEGGRMKHQAKDEKRKARGRACGRQSDRISCLLPSSAFLLCCALATAASAQQYPSRPVRVIVAQSAGSSLDTLVRIVAAKLSEGAGQQFVIDNRGGAAGTIGLEIGARAAPDGYTLIAAGVSSMIVSTFTYRKLAFDTLKDFDPVSQIADADGLLAVHPGVPARSVKELIALAKAGPGKLNMASAGVGSSSHLSGAMFTTLAGISTVHVPYKGGGPMAASVVAGESQWAIAPAAALVSHVKAGRLRALAITSKQRSPLLPDLPTIDEEVAKPACEGPSPTAGLRPFIVLRIEVPFDRLDEDVDHFDV